MIKFQIIFWILFCCNHFILS